MGNKKAYGRKQVQTLRYVKPKYNEESADSGQVKINKNKTWRKEQPIEMELDWDIKEVKVLELKTSFKLKIPYIKKETQDLNFWEGPSGWWGAEEEEDFISSSPKFWNPDSDSDDYVEENTEEIDYWRDETPLETDFWVNVAPSRISTYKSRKIIPSSKNWSERLDSLLNSVYELYPSNWVIIAKNLGDKKTPDEWRERHNHLKIWKIEGRFTQEEDNLIKKGVQEYGRNWNIIVKKYFKNRTSKQIRDRYMKSILRNAQFSTVKQIDKQFTIHENVEEESEITPRNANRDGAWINIGYLAKESEKRLQGMDSEYNSPPLRKKLLKKATDTSFCTDESVKDEMKGSDKVWYENLGEETKNNKSYYQFKNSSREEWKAIMSVSSTSNNADKLLAKASMHMSPVRGGIQPKMSLFKSKETLQDMWYNKE